MKLLFLFLIQMIWASSYVSQKIALAEMPVGLVLIFRYGIASLFFLMIGQLSWKQKITLKEWLLIVFVGILNFTGSPFFQLTALTYTYAIDVSVMIAFEPIISAFLAILFLKEKIPSSTLKAFFIATVGVLIMASSKGELGALQWTRLMGDGFFFLSLICEGTCTVTSRHLTQKYSFLPLIAWMIFAGFVANLLGNVHLLTQTNLEKISTMGWFNLAYLALFCSVLGYGVWFFLLKKIPVNQLALSLFLQPILGTILAVVILKERLDLQTLVGSLVVLSTLLFWLRSRLRQPTFPSSSQHAKSKDNQRNQDFSDSIPKGETPHKEPCR